MIGTRCKLLDVEKKYPGKWVAFSEITSVNRFYLEGILESVCTEDEFKKESDRLKAEGKQVYWYKTKKKNNKSKKQEENNYGK